MSLDIRVVPKVEAETAPSHRDVSRFSKKYEWSVDRIGV